MGLKFFLLFVSIAMLLFVFVVNWFWRWLAIPVVLIFTWDIFNSYFDKRRVEEDTQDDKKNG